MPLGSTIITPEGQNRYLCSYCDRQYAEQNNAVMCCSHACPVCGARYVWEDEAQSCCLYTCESCGETYADYADAENCCSYECPGCGAMHPSEDDAADCCGYDIPNTNPEYPGEIRELEPRYLLEIPDIPGRPARICSLEQELCGGGHAVAALIYDLGLSSNNHVEGYNRDASAPGTLIVKHDGTLPDGGGEVVYSRFDLSDLRQVKKVSRAIGCIREMRDRGFVSTTTAAGTHIHIAATDLSMTRVFGPGQMAALYEIFSFTEEVLFQIASAGWRYHRGQSYSAPLVKFDKITAGKIAVNSRRNRYFSLNFGRLLQAAQSCNCGACIAGDWNECECGTLGSGTIEWRIFNASTKPETLHAWLLLAHAMTAAAFTHELGSLSANGFGATAEENHPWIFGWILQNCPFTNEERQIIVNCAKRAPSLKIDWEDFDANHPGWGQHPVVPNLEADEARTDPEDAEIPRQAHVSVDFSNASANTTYTQ